MVLKIRSAEPLLSFMSAFTAMTMTSGSLAADVRHCVLFRHVIVVVYNDRKARLWGKVCCLQLPCWNCVLQLCGDDMISDGLTDE